MRIRKHVVFEKIRRFVRRENGTHLVEQYQIYNGVLLSSRATVSINSFQFQFAVPLIGGTVTMPAYRTSLPGESAGFVPCDIPSSTPMAPCNIIPN